MKSRTLVISDLHGCHKEFNLLLDEMKYEPSTDELIILGDLVDRGPHAMKVVQQVMEMHAGINPAFDNWKDQPERDFLYIKEPFYHHPTALAKTVVFGHTITMDLHGSASIWFGGDKIGVDGGCAYGLQLNGLEIHKTNGYKSYQVKAGS